MVKSKIALLVITIILYSCQNKVLINELEIVKSFTPKKGTVVFFQSTPNSYHGVKRFIEKNCPKRFFIYGSYALNKPVIWNCKGISYYPHIISNKKRMLTSFHDVNYLTTAPKH